MALKGTTNEERIWNYLKSKGLNDYGCAGMMGNLYAESALRPNNLQNSFEKKLGYTDDEYVAAVDSGKYANFVRDSAGFGLAQWTYWSRKQGLLNFANSTKKSIGDLEMQLNYLYKELSENYKTVLNTLKTAASVRAASDSVLLNFERPASVGANATEEQRTKTCVTRAGYGQTYYDKYASSKTNTTGGDSTGVLIGHASISETGSINGTKGDSTGKEVCVRSWYSKPWDFMAIHPDATVREKHATAIEAACENNNIGYGQNDRNTLNTQAKTVGYALDKITAKCNCDCSSLQNVAAVASGAPGVTYGSNGWTTGVMKARLQAAGYKIITDSAYLTSSDYCVRGAIYVKASAHTVCGLTNGSKANQTLTKAGVSTAGGTGSQTTPSKPNSSDIIHIVQKGDTLSKIASKYGTTYKALAAYNGIANPNVINVGQQIRIPSGGSNSGNTSTETKPATGNGGTTVGYTNSSLVSYTKISPNKNSPRNHAIDTITIHCVVGQCSVETLGNIFAPTSRQASSNYGVGVDGRIGMYVEEKDRSWCSSNAANDNRAITIEVASDTKEPYAVNAKAYAALLDLVTDICKRNGIKKLVWSTDKNERVNHLNGCNMTVHRDYANKSCPGTYLYNKHGEIAAEVNRRLGSGSTGTNANTGTNTGSSQTSTNKTFPSTPFTVQVLVSDLNYRSTGSMSGKVLGQTGKGVFTITQVKDGWGKLKSGAGWIYLENASYVKIGSTTGSTTGGSSASQDKSVDVGDIVKISSNATYYNGKAVPAWVRAKEWIVKEVSGDRVVIDKSVDGKNAICSPINTKYLTVVSDSGGTATSSFKPYLVKVTTSNLNIRKGAGTNYGVTGSITDKGTYTIVAESNGTGATKWGKLKSGAGWISLDYCKKV